MSDQNKFPHWKDDQKQSRKDVPVSGDQNQEQRKLRHTTGKNDEDDLRNPVTGDTRRSEEQVEKDQDYLDAGSGLSTGGSSRA